MNIIPRCYVCLRRIWPWHHYGMLTGSARNLYWHTDCGRRR